MRWIFKAFLQKGLSLLPGGNRFNYFFQRRVTKSLPNSDSALQRRMATAKHHLEILNQYGSCRDFTKTRFYEFGAGWDLVTPLTYFYSGVKDQTVVDIQSLVYPELIADSARRLGSYWGDSIVSVAESPTGSFTVDTLTEWGIHYFAPCDARDTKFESQSFDFISNTSVLEHIPPKDLGLVFKECARILKPDGIMSCLINLKDHYVTFDKRISCYNFLRYSGALWSLFNSPLHFQSRLRYPDYIALAQQAGLKVIHEELEKPTQTDLEFLSSLSLAREFKDKYALEDLGIKTAWIVLRKAA